MYLTVKIDLTTLTIFNDYSQIMRSFHNYINLKKAKYCTVKLQPISVNS